LPEIDPSLRWLLGTTMVLFVVAMYVVGWVAQSRVSDTEDFLVAGRRLPFSLAWMTLLATWFGAGTLLTAADEVRREGLRGAALDPFGAGACLLFAGLFVAAPLWRMQLLTVPDFFRQRFGTTAELLASLILVPSYFGWIAAQFVALAGVLELFFDLDPVIGLALVAVVGTGYTLMGGMWSVTLTDAVQVVLLLVGLIVLLVSVLFGLGHGDAWAGFGRIVDETAPHKLVLVPTESAAALLGWLGVLAVGALGNVPGQDLLQRVFAARSATTARNACLAAGGLYLLFGAVPLVLALAGDLLFPAEHDRAILPALAQAFLSPPLAVIFVVSILAAITSTIDSAILSPASVLSQNVFPWRGKGDRPRASLAGTRWAILLVAGASLALANSGEDAYALLEEAYALTLVGLFVPLMLGLYTRPRGQTAALAGMIAGTVVWSFGFALDTIEAWMDWSDLPGIGIVPAPLVATVASLVAYAVGHVCSPRRTTPN
jgi:solute:Na+ symporter, SSS family